MKKVTIQYNVFDALQIPTTQEDNYGEINERWSLSIYDSSMGKLVRYSNGNFAIFHYIGNYVVRYDLKPNEVIFN